MGDMENCPRCQWTSKPWSEMGPTTYRCENVGCGYSFEKRRDITVARAETLSEARINLEYRMDGLIAITLSYRCDFCSGYGSPCRRCTDGRIAEQHTPMSLRERIGGPAYGEMAQTFRSAL